MEGQNTAKRRNTILTVISITGCCLVLAAAALSGADRAFLYAAPVIVALIVVPFFVSFERDRPYAREIVLVAVMITLAVASRAAFFWIPQFKPIIAVIIIAGAAMGAQKGFVVGSMSAFVSNFLFGQGPWTIFQMVAWGLIGMFAGLLFYRDVAGNGTMINEVAAAENGSPGNDINDAYVNNDDPQTAKAPATVQRKKIYAMMLYGAVSCFVLHGAITDIWTVLSISDRPTLAELMTVYSAGLIPDLVLAAATVIFIALGAQPMLKKISRVQMKYMM